MVTQGCSSPWGIAGSLSLEVFPSKLDVSLDSRELVVGMAAWFIEDASLRLRGTLLLTPTRGSW